MPPRKKKAEEAVVIILDVGCAEEDEHTSVSFFQKAKECLLGLIKKKIFAQSQEVISLILMNSDETLNDLNVTADGYENISVKYPLRSVSWELARLVNDLKQTKKNSVDWLDAVEVALSYILQEQESDAIVLSNLVLISRLAGTADADQANNVLRQLKTLASELTVIGYGVDQIQEISQQYSQSKKESIARLKENVSLISNMVGKMNSGGPKNSALCSFDDTLPHLSFFKGKPVKPTPWRVELEIGSEIKLEVSGYKMIAEQERFKWSIHKRADSNPVPALADAENQPNTAVYRDIRAYVPNDDGNEREVAPEDIVKSYAFGDKIVPFSALDRDTMSYKSGPRSLKLIAFTKKKYIPKYILQGNGVYAFTCGRDSTAFAALYEALESSQVVGLVRRVYNRDNAPTVGTLYPEIIDGKKVLIYIELPFAEDEVKLKLPSLRHVSPSDEQKNAINELIDALDLSNPDASENELFCPETTYDPHLQFMYYVFSHKTLNPEEPSPTEPPEHIEKLLNLPREFRDRAEPILETIKQLFPLEEVDHKRKKDKDATNGENEKDNPENENHVDVEPVGVSSLFKPTVVQVTTLQPVQDFETLLQKGESHSEVCNQMKKVITVLAQRIVEADDLLKLIEALKTLRKSCLEKNCDLYNSWIPEFKNLAQERNLKSLWEKINEENLGLISSQEATASNISEEDAKSFLQLIDPSLEVEIEVNGEDLMMDL